MTTALTLKASTNQEAFDLVVEHLKTLPHRAVSPTGNCEYITLDNRRCAIGALIDIDDDALAEVVEQGLDGSVSYFAGPAGTDGVVPVLIDTKLDLSLLDDLQEVHDVERHWTPKGFISWQSLAQLAWAYDLDPSKVPTS